MPAQGPISHMSDTARWVAVYRTIESERPDALFHDPYARTLAGEWAAEILRTIPKGLTWAWPMIVRTAVTEVVGLADALHGHTEYRLWLFDLASPGLLSLMEGTWGPAVAAGNAPFQFAPQSGSAFFEPHGWREVEYRSIWEESLRLRRTMRFARLWQLVGRLAPRARRELWRRMSGVVLMARA